MNHPPEKKTMNHHKDVTKKKVDGCKFDLVFLIVAFTVIFAEEKQVELHKVRKKYAKAQNLDVQVQWACLSRLLGFGVL